VVSGIIDGDWSRRLNDGVFEGLHGSLMFFLPCEGCTFPSEVDEWASDCRVVLDPNAHVSGKPEKGADIGEVFAVGPVVDFGNFGGVGDAAIIIALVPKDHNFRDCNKKFLGGYGGASAVEAVENAMDIIEMFPDEVAHLVVVRDCLESTTISLVASCGPLDTAVVHEGPGNVRDFGFENEGNVFVEDGTGIGPSLW